MFRTLKFSFVPAACAVFLAGCTPQGAVRNEYPLGEKVPIGPLTYTVVETAWKSQLGQMLKIRVPQKRFMLITVSVTNGGGHEISVPLLQLEDANGKVYPESDNGEGVDNWFGILRNLNPAETQQGRLLFDVPLTSFKLRLTDGGDPGTEKYAWVQIPLRMDIDSSIQSPEPGVGLK